MGKKRIDIHACTCNSLIKIAESCGFLVLNSKKHYKIKTQEGAFVTTIPYHKKIKKHTAKAIIKRFNLLGCEVN